VKEGEEKASEKSNGEFRSDLATRPLVPDWNCWRAASDTTPEQSASPQSDTARHKKHRFLPGGREIAK
jgi:hypothetical protein